jgi:polyhydroxyalkanoate synthesis regulator phasin
MPQPKKAGTSARKSTTRQPGARQPTAAKDARKDPPPTQAPRATQSSAGPAGTAELREAQRREDQLLAAIGSLRDMLSKGVVITSDRLQETVDEAVRRGRMTRQDAEELVQNLVAIGRRQSQDALAEIEDLVERSAKETRRQARARVKSVGAAARRAPGTDRALRTVDRVRRAAGLGHAFPIIGYDELTSAQIKERLDDLNSAELRKVRDHERRNANRKSVLTAIERKLP